MDINNNNKLFYSSKLKFMKVFIYIYLFLNIIHLNVITEKQITIDLFNIIKLILILILFTFLNYLRKTSKRRIYKLIQIFLFFTIIYLTILISGNNNFVKIKTLIKYTNYINIIAYYQ
uniref:hypothetical protein n=1 Tax=Clostridium sp. TaxID=1506 RepID=UPI00262CA4E6